ncbi:restriction endonuclease [Marinilabiliaceae bacterium ANBcel2]|nr:restriction endonuclease [Marinilabiliaceae bacterium ANBcel2]
MQKNRYIIKASGEKEIFDPSKLRRSLQRSGAEAQLAENVTDDISLWVKDGMNTGKIYKRAFSLLRKKRRSMAARYSLKTAIMELGPSGYPFEHFVGHLFRCMGYSVEVGVNTEGKCVSHEVDVVAVKETHQHFVECKFYNSRGKFSSVQVPLYIRSRVNDIIDKRKSELKQNSVNYHGWVVTNTRFSEDALSFGLCSGLDMMSWDYPEKSSLKALIEKFGIFPVTTLTRLTKAHKSKLLKKNIVLCREIVKDNSLLDSLELTNTKRKRVLEEIYDLCG